MRQRGGTNDELDADSHLLQLRGRRGERPVVVDPLECVTDLGARAGGPHAQESGHRSKGRDRRVRCIEPLRELRHGPLLTARREVERP